MTLDETLLQPSEKRNLTLRKLFRENGYSPYRMSKFEEYDLYAKNKDFLISDNVITFNDTDGKLLALKPDVTLSIIKNSRDTDEIQKVSYSENVYRVSKGTGSFREIMQTGAECFGPLTEADVLGVVSLAAKSLSLLSDDWVLAVSNLDVLTAFLSDITDRESLRRELLTAVEQKNAAAVLALCPDGPAAERLTELLAVHGPLSEALPALRTLTDNAPFFGILNGLANSPFADRIYLDFSVTDDLNYYNGTVFKGFVRGIPNPVLSGGQYDRLMKKMGRASRAVGFAVYTDEFERVEEKSDDGYLNVALPKGRLGEKVYSLFRAAGYECDALLEPNRKLIFENPDKKVRYFWVKPSDVAIYVERGAADVGVAGKDILLEYEPDLYELLDLKLGKCRMAVAGPKDFYDDPEKTLRVATKFSHIARRYYQSKGRDIDIVHLNGSIEIAPILGLTDVIVDIVETGTTLKENNLEVKEEILPISARLIVNKTSYKFKNGPIETLTETIAKELNA